MLAAVDAGCDAVDGALDAMSGLTSQPNLARLPPRCRVRRATPALTCWRWKRCRTTGKACVATTRPSRLTSVPEPRTSNHEMPGGQYTNLREQARAMGLAHRWQEVSKAYADVNILFGDIVKVTPTSKVVGDLALFMVANDLTPADIRHPDKEIAFPESVISLFKGELGFPPDGFPKALETKGAQGRSRWPGVPATHGAGRPRCGACRRRGGDRSPGQRHRSRVVPDVSESVPRLCRASSVVWRRRSAADLALLLRAARPREIAVNIDQGKTLIIRQTGTSDGVDEEGRVKVFFG